MAIKIIEGVPGSGKTYYAVHHLAKTYFRLDGAGVLALVKDCTLVTNIDSFGPSHVDLSEEISKAGGVSAFFSYDYQNSFRRGKPPIVYIIDEAQRYFRRNDKTLNDAFSYFEYHRHWQQDIYLVTQNSKKLPTDITCLVEYVVVANPRIRSLVGEFKYKWMSGKEKLKTESFRPDSKVFALYKSMDGPETEEIKNPLVKTICLTFAAVFVILSCFYWYFTSRWGVSDANATVPLSSSSVVSGVSSSVVGSSFVVGDSTGVDDVRYKLSVIESYSGGSVKVSIFFAGQVYGLGDFPYGIVYSGGNYYSFLDPSEIPVVGSSVSSVGLLK